MISAALKVFVLSLAMSACADRRSFTTLPWSEREQMLMRGLAECGTIPGSQNLGTGIL